LENTEEILQLLQEIISDPSNDVNSSIVKAIKGIEDIGEEKLVKLMKQAMQECAIVNKE